MYIYTYYIYILTKYCIILQVLTHRYFRQRNATLYLTMILPVLRTYSKNHPGNGFKIYLEIYKKVA